MTPLPLIWSLLRPRVHTTAVFASHDGGIGYGPDSGYYIGDGSGRGRYYGNKNGGGYGYGYNCGGVFGDGHGDGVKDFT